MCDYCYLNYDDTNNTSRQQLQGLPSPWNFSHPGLRFYYNPVLDFGFIIILSSNRVGPGTMLDFTDN